MKTVVSISLGPESLNYDFKTTFWDKNFELFELEPIRTLKKAKELIHEWESKAMPLAWAW